MNFGFALAVQLSKHLLNATCSPRQTHFLVVGACFSNRPKQSEMMWVCLDSNLREIALSRYRVEIVCRYSNLCPLMVLVVRAVADQSGGMLA